MAKTHPIEILMFVNLYTIRVCAGVTILSGLNIRNVVYAQLDVMTLITSVYTSTGKKKG